MKILLLAENWPPRQGGIENYLFNIAKHLPQKSVTVVAPVIPEKKTLKDTPTGGIDKVIRKNFFSGFIRPSWLFLYMSLRASLKKEPVNAVICGKALFEGLIAYYIKKQLGIPYVVCTYAMEIETWAGQPRNKRKLVKVLGSADRILYINEHTKKSLLSLGATEKQLVKVWPGINTSAFEEVGEDIEQTVLKKYDITKPYILSVSRLIPRKGTELLIQAFADIITKFPDHKLVITGNGPEEQHLRSLIQELDLNKKVVILTDVSDEDLHTLYSGAEFFALTPKEDARDIEGFGIVYLEAAACGLASLGTHTGGISEAVLHKETGILVKPDSVSAITEGLIHLLQNPIETKKLGERGKERAWHEFRWNKRILLVKGVLDAVLTETILKNRKR